MQGNINFFFLDYREDNIMPDSPESKGNVQSSVSTTNHVGGPLPLTRDLSHPLSGGIFKQ